MQKKRLEMLADYLEGVGRFEGRGVPSNKFDLENWMADYEHFSRPFKNLKTNDNPVFEQIKSKHKGFNLVNPVDCQTAGCAVGWAATIPEFNKLGFFLKSTTPGQASPIYIKRDNTYHTNRWAVIEFFTLKEYQTLGEFDVLFTNQWYPKKDRRNPKSVAKRIRELIQLNSIEERKEWFERYNRRRGRYTS